MWVLLQFVGSQLNAVMEIVQSIVFESREKVSRERALIINV
jgi:hypothetical protein